MRKLSAYARKARRVNKTYNGAEWLNVITKCRPYDEELLPGAIAQESSFAAVRRAIIGIRTAFEAIKAGQIVFQSFFEPCSYEHSIDWDDYESIDKYDEWKTGQSDIITEEYTEWLKVFS